MFSILLVDDEPDVRSAWQLILELEGYHVLCAENGKRALELLERHLPTLVITDWTMPRMNGGELCREIRPNAGWRVCRLLFIALSNNLQQAKSAGLLFSESPARWTSLSIRRVGCVLTSSSPAARACVSFKE